VQLALTRRHQVLNALAAGCRRIAGVPSMKARALSRMLPSIIG
jgi:hypothetical protein